MGYYLLCFFNIISTASGMKSKCLFHVQSWPGSCFVFLDITLTHACYMGINLQFNAVKYVPSKEGTTTSIYKIKFSHNACSDWLKQRALLENRAQVDDSMLEF